MKNKEKTIIKTKLKLKQLHIEEQKLVEILINLTHGGEERNKLCDENILLMEKIRR